MRPVDLVGPVGGGGEVGDGDGRGVGEEEGVGGDRIPSSVANASFFVPTFSTIASMGASAPAMSSGFTVQWMRS